MQQLQEGRHLHPSLPLKMGLKKKIVFGPTFLNIKNVLPREVYFNKSTVNQKHDFQRFYQKKQRKTCKKKLFRSFS
jgi:hypothetical protein